MTLKTVEKWSKHETDREREGENIERNINKGLVAPRKSHLLRLSMYCMYFCTKQATWKIGNSKISFIFFFKIFVIL